MIAGVSRASDIRISGREANSNQYGIQVQDVMRQLPRSEILMSLTLDSVWCWSVCEERLDELVGHLLDMRAPHLHLGLPGNQLSDASAQRLTTLVKACAFSSLDLRENRLTEKGVVLLANAAASRPNRASTFATLHVQNNAIADPDGLQMKLQSVEQVPYVELSVPWSVAEADAALNACQGPKSAHQAPWDEYWHGALALLRLTLEAQPLNEVPQSARCTVCEVDVRSNKEYPLPGSLARHLGSVPHRKKLQWLRCGDTSCIHPPTLTVQLKREYYCMSLLSGIQGFGGISENVGSNSHMCISVEGQQKRGGTPSLQECKWGVFEDSSTTSQNELREQLHEQSASCAQPLTRKTLHKELDRCRGGFRSSTGAGMIDLTTDPRFSDWKLMFPEADRAHLVNFTLEAHDTATDFCGLEQWYYVGTLPTGERITFHVSSSKRGPWIFESIASSVLGVGSRGQLFMATKADLLSAFGRDKKETIDARLKARRGSCDSFLQDVRLPGYSDMFE